MERDPNFLLFSTPADKFKFKGLTLLGIMYFGSLAFASLLSPLIFQLTHYLDPDASSYLANKPFADFYDRARLGFVILLLPVLFIKCGITSTASIGFKGSAITTSFKWTTYGIGMIGIVYIVLFAMDTIAPNHDWSLSKQVEQVGSAFIGALVVALFEETFFRGLVFRIFYTAFRPWTAILLSSLFFASLHFKMQDAPLSNLHHSEIWFGQGLFASWQTLTAFSTQFNAILFINLTLVGILLHQCFIWKQNIWANIGLHTGWVLVILSLSRTFKENENANVFTGSARVADGILVGIIMLVFILIFEYKTRSHNKNKAKLAEHI